MGGENGMHCGLWMPEDSQLVTEQSYLTMFNLIKVKITVILLKSMQ